jgi:hypothetical protein
MQQHLPDESYPRGADSAVVTGCGCLALLALLVALLVIFVRGSFDAGEPIEQAAGLVAAGLLLCRLYRWRREWPTHELVRARGA